jgi:hypothetical protein
MPTFPHFSPKEKKKSNNKNLPVRTGVMTQVVECFGPEFKPQYCRKKQKQTTKNTCKIPDG